jgi:predicted Zn-ribbon and HTH transcriptional regulator
VALGGSDFFEQVHNEKTEECGGWVRGCDAELDAQPRDIIAQLNNPSLMRKCGYMFHNMKRIISVGSKNPECRTRSKIEYESRKDGRVITQPLGKFNLSQSYTCSCFINIIQT